MLNQREEFFEEMKTTDPPSRTAVINPGGSDALIVPADYLEVLIVP